MGYIDLDALERVALFTGLNRSRLEKIRPCCESVGYKLDERIFAEGEEAECIYFVIDGQVDIRFELPNMETSRNMTIVTIVPGKSFGWAGMVEPYQYTRSAYSATEKCVVGRMKADDLRQVFDEDEGTGYVVMTNLARVIAKRFHVLQDEVANRGGWA